MPVFLTMTHGMTDRERQSVVSRATLVGIQDNNEGNPLENFFYSFSTGDRLDSMAVAGTVLNLSLIHI